MRGIVVTEDLSGRGYVKNDKVRLRECLFNWHTRAYGHDDTP